MKNVKSTARLFPGACAVAVALCAAVATPAYAQAAPGAACQPVTESQVAALFERWNSSLRTLSADQVTANYASDGVLLPTVSNEPRTNPAQIKEYFGKFLKTEPQGTIDQRIVKIGCNLAQDVGTYTFKFKDGQTVKARYTFVYEYQNGQWLIAHHHSSAMPEVGKSLL